MDRRVRILILCHTLPALAVVVLLNIALAGEKTKTDSLPPVLTIDHRGIYEMVRSGDRPATLVNVWATWCEPCREEMPGLLRLRQRFLKKGVQFIFVSADDIEKPDSSLASMLHRLGVDFVTYRDNDSTDEAFISGMNPDWSGALPASFIYNREGKLVEMMVGGKSYRTFEKALAKVLR